MPKTLYAMPKIGFSIKVFGLAISLSSVTNNKAGGCLKELQKVNRGKSPILLDIPWDRSAFAKLQLQREEP